MSNEDDFDDQPGRPTATPAVRSTLGCLVTILAVGWGLAALWFFGSPKIRDSAERLSASGNMKQIGFGCLNYESTYGVLPTNSYDANGRPLLSWRVHILPFIEQDALYKQFYLDEPWDSARNRPLLSQMPRMYATQAQRQGRASMGDKTCIRGFATRGAVMEPRSGRPVQNPAKWLDWKLDAVAFDDITDGPGSTILFVEAGEAAEWTKPNDLTWDVGQPMPPFGAGRPGDDFWICYSDDSVRRANKLISPEQLKAAITYNGNETETLD